MYYFYIFYCLLLYFFIYLYGTTSRRLPVLSWRFSYILLCLPFFFSPFIHLEGTQRIVAMLTSYYYLSHTLYIFVHWYSLCPLERNKTRHTTRCLYGYRLCVYVFMITACLFFMYSLCTLHVSLMISSCIPYDFLIEISKGVLRVFNSSVPPCTPHVFNLLIAMLP